MLNKLKELPPIFSEISDRFASDYLIAYKLHFTTEVKIDAVRFPLSLLKSSSKEYDESIFNEIFSRVLDNDKKLSSLLKKAKIESLNIPKE